MSSARAWSVIIPTANVVIRFHASWAEAVLASRCCRARSRRSGIEVATSATRAANSWGGAPVAAGRRLRNRLEKSSGAMRLKNSRSSSLGFSCMFFLAQSVNSGFVRRAMACKARTSSIERNRGAGLTSPTFVSTLHAFRRPRSHGGRVAPHPGRR